MIRKKTWILLASFGVVLAAYLVWDAVVSDESPGEVTPSPEPLWSVTSEDVVGVVVEDLEALETLELMRDEEQLWKISEPDLGPADVARVERAVSWLASPSPRSVILDVPDLAAFQLEAPLFRVELLMADGEKLSLNIGRESPTGSARYVSEPGRSGVFTFSTFGLDEVLTLREDLLATPTVEPALTELSETPAGTVQPADEATAEPAEATSEPDG